ncbi:MAG: integrase [Pseudohongiellaceae bacterium]
MRKDGAGIQRKRRIAGPNATLADLHKAIELHNGKPVDCLEWLAAKFEGSPQFARVSDSMQSDWRYCRRVLNEQPTLSPDTMVSQIPLSDWDAPMIQRLIDDIGETRGPSSAKHLYTYLKRLWNWGHGRGHCGQNPAPAGAIELPPERQRRRIPDPLTLARLITFAQERGRRPSRTTGSCPAYIWMALEIAYLNRLRGIEVFASTDAEVLDEGFLCRRTKGSADTITRWNARLRAVVDAAQAERARIWKARSRAIPLDPAKRPLLVSTAGGKVGQSSWQSAWRRFMDLAVREGVLSEEQRFGLHDMKRRGATDTKGSKADKMESTGHSSLQMLKVYDTSIAVVDAASD